MEFNELTHAYVVRHPSNERRAYCDSGKSVGRIRLAEKFQLFVIISAARNQNWIPPAYRYYLVATARWNHLFRDVVAEKQIGQGSDSTNMGKSD